jgi:hypothetical protein
MVDRDQRPRSHRSREVPEEWEGLWVTVEHLACNDQGVLGVGATLGVLEMVDEKGAVLMPGGVEQEELQFFPWNSIIRIRMADSGHR